MGIYIVLDIFYTIHVVFILGYLPKFLELTLYIIIHSFLKIYMPNILKEGKNSVSFSLENNNYLYEKLSNTLHLGKDKEISRIQKLAESLTYNPFFESDTLKNKSNKLTESLLLNITESCNLKCGYCIYSGDYDGERTNNSTKN